MKAEWLRYFVTLAQTRNFHQAAEQLHITPQALSKAITGLEHELKQKLVERDHRVRGLTMAGSVLLEEARTILQSLENAERRMAECLSDEPQGPVRIAGDSLWHHYLMPPLLTDLLSRYQRLKPQLYEMIPDDIEHWVATGEVDIGLLLRHPTRTDLEWVEGLSSPYVIAGKPQPTRPWQELGYIVPRLFRRELPDSLDGWPEHRFPRRIAAEVELLETAIHLCEAGLGVAYLPELALHDRIRDGKLAIVAEAPCQFADTLYIVWRKGIRHSPASRAILQALEAL